MKWTTERPTKNGQYWATLKNNVAIWQPVLIDFATSCKWVYVFGNENQIDIGIFDMFSDEPIEPPPRS